MIDNTHPALLPAGLADVLPPDAGFEANTTEELVGRFEQFGYARVKPPLIEFEDSLVTGSGEATATQTFRMMDPISQRMLGVRPDITVQVARIATTRLAGAPRPLRLSYAGQVLRIKGSPLRPERQFGQVGAELIGADGPEADAEIILMTAEALLSIGVTGLSIDLGTPTLVATVSMELGLDAAAPSEELRAALNQKDATTLSDYGDQAVRTFGALLDAAGPADRALTALGKAELPATARDEISHLGAVVEIVSREAPDLSLTVDPVEIRGYEYHTGVTFTYFALNARTELGRGGRYLAKSFNGDASPEPATGITLFLDALLHVVPKPPPTDRLFLPPKTARTDATRLRDEGWTIFPGLDLTADHWGEAARLGCTHIWENGRVVRLDDAGEE